MMVSVVCLQLNLFQLPKRKSIPDGKVHLVWMNEYEERKHEESIDKAWATDFKCAFAHQEDYLVAGYYSTTSATPDFAIGSFFFSLRP